MGEILILKDTVRKANIQFIGISKRREREWEVINIWKYWELSELKKISVHRLKNVIKLQQDRKSRHIMVKLRKPQIKKTSEREKIIFIFQGLMAHFLTGRQKTG